MPHFMWYIIAPDCREYVPLTSHGYIRKYAWDDTAVAVHTRSEALREIQHCADQGRRGFRAIWAEASFWLIPTAWLGEEDLPTSLERLSALHVDLPKEDAQ